MKYYATILGLSATFSLIGCSNRDFEYKSNENGDYVVEGKISYEYLKSYKVIELKFNDAIQIYIAACCSRRNEFSKKTEKWYRNIYTGEILYDERTENTNLEFIGETNLPDYLIFYEEVKKEYSIEDIERIYEKIKEDY